MEKMDLVLNNGLIIIGLLLSYSIMSQVFLKKELGGQIRTKLKENILLIGFTLYIFIGMFFGLGILFSIGISITVFGILKLIPNKIWVEQYFQGLYITLQVAYISTIIVLLIYFIFKLIV